MCNIAFVVPNFPQKGGVSSVSNFLIQKSTEFGYNAGVVSLATSSTDSNSSHVWPPEYWFGREKKEEENENVVYTHFGCSLSELEPLRYAPRPELTSFLQKHDLVQVVAGHPAWALVAKNVDQPVALQVATLAKVERAMKRQEGGGFVGAWRSLMTEVAHPGSDLRH